MKYFFVFFICIFSIVIQAKLLPVEAFGQLPQVKQVKLSPDGNNIAFIRNVNGMTLIGIIDLKEQASRYIVRTDNQRFKIGWYTWASDKIILISADYPVSRNGVKYKEARLLKVDIYGTKPPITVFKPKRKERNPQFQNNIIDLLPDDPDHILMALDLNIANAPDVYKVNLSHVKKRKRIYRAKQYINDWMTDQQHRLRLGFGRDDTRIFYRLYDLKTEKWRNIWDYEIFDAPDITPLGFGLNPNELYIRADHNGRYALFKVDVSKKDLPRTLVYADDKYDLDGSLIYSKKTNDVIGVYHSGSSGGKVFFAELYKKSQQAIDKAIPDAYNVISDYSANERRYILYSSKNSAPGAYYLGDKDTKELSFIMAEYPLLAEQPLSTKKKISYIASDKTEIEAYVTLPPKTAPKTHSALVIPHGGPMSSSHAGFDWFTEFFANRGYTIIEPNFRGSSGYGFQFAMESIQNWGGAMQDDLADAANWLTKKYPHLEGNVCIIGASYGGYAALMAAVKQQDVFRCAGSLAGVSDLEYIIRLSRRFTNSKVVKKQIGDDSDKLEQQSPVNFAEKVNIPVLLIHGDKDRVVNVKHSRMMYEELQDEDKDVQYVELKNGNHYLEIEENRIKTLATFEKFLAKHLLNKQN